MQKLVKPLLAVKTKSGYSILTAIVVTLFSTWAIFVATKAEVVLAADGDEQVVKTHTTTVGELLDDLDIDVGEFDQLSHNENAKIVDGMKIQFQTANKIQFTIDGDSEEFYTTALTVSQFLEEEGIDVEKHDKLSPNKMTVLKDGIEIEVEKAFQIILHNGAEEKEDWTTGGTVKNLIQENNITWDKQDKIKPGLKEKITKDTEISITRVEMETEEVEESIPFKTEEKKDSSLEKGTTKTISEGEEGKVFKIYEVTLENGKEVDRKVMKQDI